MKITFYLQQQDIFTLSKYLEDYDETEDTSILYISNQPTSPQDILVTIGFLEYNELLDLGLIEII